MVIKQRSSRQAAVLKATSECVHGGYVHIKEEQLHKCWLMYVVRFCLLTSMSPYVGCFLFSNHIYVGMALLKRTG